MGQSSYFLKIDGVEGASADKTNTKEIELESWSWGQTNSAENGSCVGQVAMQDFTFTTKDGKASPMLFLKCALGKQLKSAVLTCRQATGKQDPYLTIKLSPVVVSAFSTGGAGGDNLYPIDQVTINFGTIEYAKAPIKDDAVGTMDTHKYSLFEHNGS